MLETRRPVSEVEEISNQSSTSAGAAGGGGKGEGLKFVLQSFPINVVPVRRLGGREGVTPHEGDGRRRMIRACEGEVVRPRRGKRKEGLIGKGQVQYRGSVRLAEWKEGIVSRSVDQGEAS